MAAQPGMLAPDLVGYGDRLDRERACLQEFEAGTVERPFNLDRPADHGFSFEHHAAERHCLRGVKTRRTDQLRWHRLRRGAVPAALAVLLAAGLDLAQKT